MLVGVACDRDTAEPDTTDNQTDDNGDAAQGGNLFAEVKERGLRCGVNETVPGFGFNPGSGEIEGFDIDFCKAFAAAITGDANNFELVPIDADNRFIALQAGDYDVLVRNTTWTTSRDGGEGVFFAHPNFYDGQAVGPRVVLEDPPDDLERRPPCRGRSVAQGASCGDGLPRR